MPSAPARAPVRTKPSSSSASVPPSQSVHGAAPRKRKRYESGIRSPSRSVAASSWPSAPCEGGDLAASADQDAGALEVVDQVVRHRLAQVGPAVEQCHERAAAGEPDRRLGGRVPAADNTDPCRAAALGLLWPRRVEDADAFVRLDLRNREPSVLGSGREDDGARPHLLSALEPHEMVLDAGLERDGAVRRGRAGAELPCLADRADRQFRAADARREAEVVLDPPRCPRLAAESAALDHERVEPLRRAVDGGAEPGRAASDDEQVDRLGLVEVEPDAQRPGHLAGRGIPQLVALRAGARAGSHCPRARPTGRAPRHALGGRGPAM